MSAFVRPWAVVIAVSACILGTAWLCVSSWWVLWLAGVAAAWVVPGVVGVLRAYRDCRSRIGLALLLGAPVGFAMSSLVLLAAWLAGWQSALWLLGAPAIATGLAWWTPSLGSHLDVPRFGRRDVLAVALLLLLVPLVVARPYSRVGADLPEGRAYRAYFTADFVWAMAVVSEVSKGDVLPVNPFHQEMPLHYYWMAHLMPSLEHRTLAREVRLDHLLLADAVFSGVAFVAFLYALGKHVTRGVSATVLGCLVSVLFTSPEGLYALVDLWRQARPLSLVQYLNIDAISRWLLGTLPVDGLQRLLLYQPHHQMGYALGCLGLLVMMQQRRQPRVRASALAGLLLGVGLLVSTFSAFMLAVMTAGVAGVAIVRTRAWRTGVWQALAAGVPLMTAVWLSRRLEYIEPDDHAFVQFGVNPLVREHPLTGLALSLGPLLLILLIGLWWGWRQTTRHRRDRFLMPLIALVVSLAFYYFVDVRDHQDVYVGWRAGHLILITAGGTIGWTWWRLVHRSRRALSGMGLASLVLVVGLTAPTVAIDLYNTQDVSNREQAAGFPWTLVLGHDELNALQWIARNTPLDARVQVDALARNPATWAYIPAFGERRMAGGLPISMIPVAPYEAISRRIRALYEMTDADEAFTEARALRIDVLVMGPEERRLHPAFGLMLDEHQGLFPALYRTRNVTLYATSGRMRQGMRPLAP